METSTEYMEASDPSYFATALLKTSTMPQINLLNAPKLGPKSAKLSEIPPFLHLGNQALDDELNFQFAHLETEEDSQLQK
jgi:hypothetical protein